MLPIVESTSAAQRQLVQELINCHTAAESEHVEFTSRLAELNSSIISFSVKQFEDKLKGFTETERETRPVLLGMWCKAYHQALSQGNIPKRKHVTEQHLDGWSYNTQSNYITIVELCGDEVAALRCFFTQTRAWINKNQDDITKAVQLFQQERRALKLPSQPKRSNIEMNDHELKEFVKRPASERKIPCYSRQVETLRYRPLAFFRNDLPILAVTSGDELQLPILIQTTATDENYQQPVEIIAILWYIDLNAPKDRRPLVIHQIIAVTPFQVGIGSRSLNQVYSDLEHSRAWFGVDTKPWYIYGHPEQPILAAHSTLQNVLFVNHAELMKSIGKTTFRDLMAIQCWSECSDSRCHFGTCKTASGWKAASLPGLKAADSELSNPEWADDIQHLSFEPVAFLCCHGRNHRTEPQHWQKRIHSPYSLKRDQDDNLKRLKPIMNAVINEMELFGSNNHAPSGHMKPLCDALDYHTLCLWMHVTEKPGVLQAIPLADVASDIQSHNPWRPEHVQITIPLAPTFRINCL